jgi:hypothetical protein
VLRNVQDNFTTIGGTIDQYPYYFVTPEFSRAPSSRKALLESLGLKAEVAAAAASASHNPSKGSTLNLIEISQLDSFLGSFFAMCVELMKKPNFRYSAEKIKEFSHNAFGHDVLGFKLLRYYLTGRADGEELEQILRVLPHGIITQRLTFAKSDFEIRQ